MKMHGPQDRISNYPREQKHAHRDSTHMDVSDIARALGFTQRVQVSVALHDAIFSFHAEEDEYDQHLYDLLWLAHHHLFLDERPCFAFTFHFVRTIKIATTPAPASVRVRIEVQSQQVLVDLARDGKEA